MHEGHRGRLLGKIKSDGVVYEHELLEILLFNSCPRRDLNATAHALISKFGSIKGVLDAEVGELVKVDGVGKNMAEYIVCLGKALARGTAGNAFAVLTCTADFKKFISMRRKPENDVTEFFMTDKDGRLRRICALNAGEITGAEILKYVSVFRPYGLFVAERRSLGGFAPDENSDAVCAEVYKAANLCGVKLYDYCIVSEDGKIFSYFIADRMVFGNLSAGEKNGQ